MTDNTPPVESAPSKRWYQRWWVWAIAAVVVLMAIAGSMSGSEDGEDSAAASTTSIAEETTTTGVETTTTTKAEETTTTEAETTTTQPTTTTSTIPTIGSGTYIVPDEVAPDTYRVVGYAARLDADLEIIDNFLVGDNGVGLVIVQPTDSYLEVNGEIVLVSETPALDPIALEFTSGAYLVGYDIEPGRYRVQPVDGTSYWARMDDQQEIIDNDLSDGASIVIVKEGDWALEINGSLELLP